MLPAPPSDFLVRTAILPGLAFFGYQTRASQFRRIGTFHANHLQDALLGTFWRLNVFLIFGSICSFCKLRLPSFVCPAAFGG